MRKEEQLYAALKENGFSLVRKSRHEVWQNRAGLQVILSCSPSDQHWAAMARREICEGS